ncbi:unnamed protein product, partial [Amoebophrya sp. A25]
AGWTDEDIEGEDFISTDGNEQEADSCRVLETDCHPLDSSHPYVDEDAYEAQRSHEDGCGEDYHGDEHIEFINGTSSFLSDDEVDSVDHNVDVLEEFGRREGAPRPQRDTATDHDGHSCEACRYVESVSRSPPNAEGASAESSPSSGVFVRRAALKSHALLRTHEESQIKTVEKRGTTKRNTTMRSQQMEQRHISSGAEAKGGTRSTARSARVSLHAENITSRRANMRRSHPPKKVSVCVGPSFDIPR